MIELKLQCGCGTRYKFDVEPLDGRMPSAVSCPSCGADGTAAANEILSQQAPATGGIRLARSPSTPAVQPQGAPAAPRGLLDRQIFLVKERVAIVKLTDTFDILDPGTGQKIGIAKEEPPPWAKWLRLVVSKQLLPTTVNIYEQENAPPVASIHRGFTMFRSKIKVVGGNGSPLGYFKSKVFSLGGGFFVFDNADQQVAEVKGDWKGWNFKFLTKSGREIGTVTKKWAGLGKELFTSADNYVISITDPATSGPAAGALLLAAGVSIDIVFKEKK
jgi:uncharacterized protein YxjI